MEELINYFKNIEAEFILETDILQEKEIPQVMQNFYEKIKSVDLPFGRIYNLELALRNSKKNPFYPNWFVFGQDNYFNFWLCSKKENKNGCYYTYWDHESGLDIEEPVWEDLLSFLKEMEEDSKDEW